MPGPKRWAGKPAVSELEAEAKRLGYDGDDLRPAVLLLSAATVGPNEAAAFTRYPPRVTNPMMARLRSGKVFVRNHIRSDWMNPQTGGIEFALCVAVARGFVTRAEGAARSTGAIPNTNVTSPGGRGEGAHG